MSTFLEKDLKDKEAFISKMIDETNVKVRYLENELQECKTKLNRLEERINLTIGFGAIALLAVALKRVAS